MYKKLIYIAIVFITMNACQKTLDPGTTKAAKVANEWWVNYYLNGVPQNATFSKFETYNTAANNDSIWLDDLGNTQNFKVKAKFDAAALSFLTSNAVNENNTMPNGSPLTVTVTEAKIMPLAAKSTTGVLTDSIYFKVTFLNHPDTVFVIKGTGRTKWKPDDY